MINESTVLYSLIVTVFCLINYKVYICNKYMRKSSDNEIELINNPGLPRSPTKSKFDNVKLEEGLELKTEYKSNCICSYCNRKIDVLDKKKKNLTVEYRAYDSRICSSCYSTLSSKRSSIF